MEEEVAASKAEDTVDEGVVVTQTGDGISLEVNESCSRSDRQRSTIN